MLHLELPTSSKIHDTFHVPQLKKKIGSCVLVQTNQPRYDEDKEDMRPEAIIDMMVVKKKNKTAARVLIIWTNTSLKDDTWVSYEWLLSKFPDFQP